MALTGLLVVGSWPSAAAAVSPDVHTVAGPGAVGQLSAPHGIALDAAGDLFIADTDHCAVVLVPDHAGTLFGKRVVPHHAYTLAGGNCQGRHAIGFPTGVAVDHHGDVFIAEATSNRVQEVRTKGGAPVTVAGTGQAGFNGNGRVATQSQLSGPSGIAVSDSGNLFIADTDNCRIRVLPQVSGTYFGQTMSAGHLYTVAGTGVCGSASRGGPGPQAQVWEPVAVAVDQGGDLFIADTGDQSVLELAAQAGTYYGTPIGTDDLATIVGMGQYGPYLVDGLSATSVAAELNDPEGVAVASNGNLYVADGDMHCLRVVPRSSITLLGRSMTGGNLYTLAGALPVTVPDQPAGDGNRWIIAQMDVPIGVAVSRAGDLFYSDSSEDQVRELR
jgi:hypothetical protein